MRLQATILRQLDSKPLLQTGATPHRISSLLSDAQYRPTQHQLPNIYALLQWSWLHWLGHVHCMSNGMILKVLRYGELVTDKRTTSSTKEKCGRWTARVGKMSPIIAPSRDATYTGVGARRDTEVCRRRRSVLDEKKATRRHVFIPIESVPPEWACAAISNAAISDAEPPLATEA